MPELVLTDMNARLRAAAAAVTDHRDAYRAAVEQRNALVVTAVDEGMSQRAVAAAAGIAVSRVSGLLLEGLPAPDVDEP